MESDWARDDEHFVENMRRRREELGWTQGDLASRLRDAGLTNMHQTTVSRMEKGERAPRVGEARGIAQVLETTVNQLISPPASVAVANRVRLSLAELRNAYTLVVRSLGTLDSARTVLQYELLRADEDLPPEWWAEAGLTQLHEACERALKDLTENHALDEYHREGSEREDDGEHSATF